MSGEAAPSISWHARHGLLTRLALIGALLALFVLGLGMRELSREQVESSGRVQETLEVIARVAVLRADIEKASSEVRGFTVERLAGNEPQMSERSVENESRVARAMSQLQGDIQQLRASVTRNPVQSAAVDALVPMIAARIDRAQHVIEQAKIDKRHLIDMALTRRGREMTDGIVAALDSIEAEECREFRSLEEASQAAERWLVTGVVGCGVLAAASLLLAAAMWQARNRERAHLAALNASVAERRRSELALRDSEERFRAMADSIPNLLFEINPRGRAVYANANLTAYTGVDLLGLAEQGWLELIEPDDRARALKGWSAALRDGTVLEIEYRVRRHDGVSRWFLCRCVPIRDATGAITRWLGTATDIDDQKRAEAVLSQHRDELERLVEARTAELAASEADLRETAARFRLITEHSSDMVSRAGADGTILYVSPACQRIFGVAPSALTREVLLSRIHPDDLLAVTAMRNQLVSGRVESEILNYRIIHVDGGIRWMETAAKSLRHEVTGEPDGVFSVLRDVTERRRLEETLRQGQKMEVIGRISAGVAHDFNNILQTVISGLELTLDSMEAGAPGRDFAEMALGSASRGSDLTHHLLSYARKQMLQPRVIALAPFLSEMQRLLSRTLGPHIHVRIDCSDDVAPVWVDPNQLQTALLNLAINGADAMPEGGTLTIDADPAGMEKGERLVALQVTDNGIGMDAATLAQACEPFFSTKAGDGTGLGLSMVQGFAEQSGGRLRIESEVGRGTTAVLLFRAAHRAVKPPPDRATLPQPSRRVLVVDDEPDVLVTAGAFLERAGLWVVHASSGNEALARLAGNLPFDALVTDYAMPGMNGADLALEGQTIRPGLPVVIITGFAEVRELETLPANIQLLHKPFMRDDLLKALRSVMLLGDDALAADL